MEYCVYITTYLGNKFPAKYIGSSSTKRVSEGYRGSVRSRKWEKLWKDELNENPNLFNTEIISYHETRDEALQEELRMQIKYGVVKSTEWVNESYATVNGFFGRDVSGNLNPNYGKCNLKEWVKNNPEKTSERNRKAALTQWANPETATKRIQGMHGKIKSRKTQTHDEFIAMQKSKAVKAGDKIKRKIVYNEITYYGWNALMKATGVTRHLYMKYYLNGIDPTPRIDTNGPISKSITLNLKGGSP